MTGYNFRGTSQNWLEFVTGNRLQLPISNQFIGFDYISGTMMLNPKDYFQYTGTIGDYNNALKTRPLSDYLLGFEILEAGGQQTVWYSQRSFNLLWEGLIK